MAKSQHALYDKKDLQTLIQKGAVEPLIGNDGTVRALKARTTPDKTARCLTEAYQTIPKGGILLQPILFNYDERGNLTSYTNRHMNPDGSPNGKYDHGTLIAFQKGGNGEADRVTYVDSEGRAMPREFRQKLEQSFPGVQISEATIVQQEKTNKRDCGPNVVRNATAVVEAFSQGKPIEPSIFTVPTAAHISAQRMKDAGIRVTEEASEQAAVAQKAGQDIPYVPVTQQIVGSLQQIIQEENSPPGPMMQLMMGYIPNTPPQNGLPVTYTPKTLLAAIGLRILGLAFGLDENVTSLPSWGALAPENSFAFRANNFTKKLKDDKWAFEGTSPFISVFIDEVKASLKKDEAMKAERLAREKQEYRAELRAEREAAMIAREKTDPFAEAAAQARKAGLAHAPEDSGLSSGETSSNVDRLAAQRSTTKISQQL